MVEHILLGFRSALTRVINKYFNEEIIKKIKLLYQEKILKKAYSSLINKMPDPKFSSQTKDKLVSSEIRILLKVY